LGFVIVAVSEHLIHSIRVGDDLEMLMSDLQNQFPTDVIEIIENDEAELGAQVVDSIERPDRALKLPDDVICSYGRAGPAGLANRRKKAPADDT
jgi:hypothetical protein